MTALTLDVDALLDTWEPTSRVNCWWVIDTLSPCRDPYRNHVHVEGRVVDRGGDDPERFDHGHFSWIISLDTMPHSDDWGGPRWVLTPSCAGVPNFAAVLFGV